MKIIYNNLIPFKGYKCINLFGILFRHAYRDISFEQEAYYHEEDMKYLKNRKHYAWIKYLFKTYKRK